MDPTRSSTGPPRGDRQPSYRCHLIPRTRAGRWIAGLFLALFALTQPPVVHGLADRIEPWVLGLPFLYAYLTFLYGLLIGVLLIAIRRRL